MGSGLSLGVARRFADEGFAIGAIGRSVSGPEEYRSRLGEKCRSFAARADAAKEEELVSAMQACERELGAASVLVYNAAFMRDAALVDLSPADLRTDFAVNVLGALAATRAVLPTMRRAKQGTLLFTGGGLALYPVPRLGALAIGKAGIRTLALTLAMELAPEGIHAATVTVCGPVQPGTFYDPARIADQFWKLHMEDSPFTPEIVYSQRELAIRLHYQDGV